MAHRDLRPRAWLSIDDFVQVLFDWADHLPPDKLPPREADFARSEGCSAKTVARWLDRAGIMDWDYFVSQWMARRLNGHIPDVSDR